MDLSSADTRVPIRVRRRFKCFNFIHVRLRGFYFIFVRVRTLDGSAESKISKNFVSKSEFTSDTDSDTSSRPNSIINHWQWSLPNKYILLSIETVENLSYSYSATSNLPYQVLFSRLSITIYPPTPPEIKVNGFSRIWPSELVLAGRTRVAWTAFQPIRVNQTYQECMAHHRWLQDHRDNDRHLYFQLLDNHCLNWVPQTSI